MRTKAVFALTAALLAAAGSTWAADYVSVADGPAILYDSPSTKGSKLFVVSRYMPLELIVKLKDWVKVRDSSSNIAWIEERALSSKHFVVVTSDLSPVRQAPEDNAAILAQVKKQVVLEWLDNTGSGWVKIRIQNNVTGYVRAADVWGN